MKNYKIVPEVISGNKYHAIYSRSLFFFWSYLSLYSTLEEAQAAIIHLNTPVIYE